MSTLTRFCTLSHLDLDFSCWNQVTACNTESATGYLLNCRATVIFTACRCDTFSTFTAFTCIGFSMQMVHCNCKSLMSFLWDRTIGHCTCLKALNDIVYAFNFFDRNSIFRIVKFQKSTKSSMTFFVYQCSILFKQIIAACPGRFLKQMNCLWIVLMLFTLASHFMCTDTVQSKIRIQA